MTQRSWQTLELAWIQSMLYLNQYLISEVNIFDCRYPETVTLNLGQTLSSGHGSVSFSSDAECSQFVKSFFPQCGAHMQSCHEVVKWFNYIHHWCIICQFCRLRWTGRALCWWWAACLASTQASWSPSSQIRRSRVSCSTSFNGRSIHQCFVIKIKSCFSDALRVTLPIKIQKS